MRFLFYLLLAYLAYQILKIVVGFFFTASFDLKNGKRGFNFSSRQPRSKNNNRPKPNNNPNDSTPIDKKDIIDAEFEEITTTESEKESTK